MCKKVLSVLLCVCLCASLAGGLVKNIFAVPSMAAGDIAFGKVATASSNLTIRSGPGTNYGSIRLLPKGYIVEIITPNYIQGWHKVKYSYRTGGVNYRNEVGYCSADYVTILQTGAKLLKLVYEEDDYCVNVRSTAGGGSITEYASGAYMEWDGTKSGRYYKVYNAYEQAWYYVHDSVAVQYDTSTGVNYPSAAAGIEENTIYNIQNVSSGLYMYSSGTSGGNITQSALEQTGNCRWKFVLLSDGYYKIVSALDSNMVLAAASSGEGQQNLTLASDSDAANKRWNIIKQGNYYIFRSKSSDRNYSAASQNSSSGSVLIQQANSSGNNQYWALSEPSLSPPVISIEPETLTNQDVTVTIAFPSQASVKQYSIDNGAWQNYTAPFSVQLNSTVSARYYDAQGLISPSATYTISNIDKTPPTAPEISASVQEEGAIISISYPSDAAVKQYRIDNGAWQDYTQSFTLFQGGTVTARCYDQAGNASDLASYEISLPPAAPVFISQPDGSVASDSYTITINYPDSAVVKQYRLGQSGQWLDYTGSLVITQSLTVYAKCYNAAGEVSPTAEYQVVIQEASALEAPQISASPSLEQVTSGPVIITLTVPEEADGAQYRIDSGEWQEYAQPFEINANALIEARSVGGGEYSSVACYEVKNITSFAQPPAPSSPAENPEEGGMLYIMRACLLYELPNVEADSVAALNLNVQVKLYEYDADNSGWSIVKHPDGYVGYVPNSVLSEIQTVDSPYKEMDILNIWAPYEPDAYYMSPDGTGTVQEIPMLTAQTAYVLYVLETDEGVKYAAIPDVTNISAASRPVGWVLGNASRVYRSSQTASESYYSREFPVKYVNGAGLFLTSVSQSSVQPQISGMALDFNQEVTVLFTAEDIGQSVVMTQNGYIGWLDTDKLADEKTDVQEETVFLTMQVTYPDGLNLRSGPAVSYDLIAELPLYSLVEVISEGINTPWALVRVKSDDAQLDGLIGYCSLNLTQHFAGSSAISEDLWVTMYTIESASLLKQPASGAQTASELNVASPVSAAAGASRGDYYLVKTQDGAYGYIHKDYLSFIQPAEPGPAEYKTNKDQVILSANEVNISTDYYLPKGLYVNVVWESDTQYGVYIPGDNNHSGRVGFIDKADLDLVNYNRFDEWQENYQTYYVQEATPFRMVPDAHSDYDYTFDINETVTVIMLDYDSQWALVYADYGVDCLGYVYSQFLGLAPAATAPSPTVIDVNQSVQLVGNCLEETPVLATLTPSNIESLEVLEEVYVLNTGKYWYAVRVISQDSTLNDMVGYVFKQDGLYSIVDEGSQTWYNLNNQNMYSSGNGVRIRRRPDTSDDSNIITTVNKGQDVRVVYKNFNDEWSIVRGSNYIGYMYNEYISEVRQNDSQYIKTMAVRNAVNLRTGPGTGYEEILEIPAGAQVNVIDMNDSKWYHIEYQGNTGYCSSSYLYDIGGSSGELPEGFENAMFLKHDDYYAVGAVRYTYIANDVMNLRSAPSGGSVVAALANDTAVTILEQTDYGDSFVKVRVNSTNQVGYIFKPSLYVRPLAGHSSDSGKIMSSHVLQDGYKEVLKEMADALGTHYLVLAGILQRECSGSPNYTDNNKPIIRIEGRSIYNLVGEAKWQDFVDAGYHYCAYYREGKAVAGQQGLVYYFHIDTDEQRKNVIAQYGNPTLWEITYEPGDGSRKNINSGFLGALGVEKYGYLYDLADIAGNQRKAVFNSTSYGCGQIMGGNADEKDLAMSAESMLDRMSTGNLEQLEFMFRYLDYRLNNSSNSARAEALGTLRDNPFNKSVLRVLGSAYNGRSGYGDDMYDSMEIIRDKNGMS